MTIEEKTNKNHYDKLTTRAKQALSLSQDERISNTQKKYGLHILEHK